MGAWWAAPRYPLIASFVVVPHPWVWKYLHLPMGRLVRWVKHGTVCQTLTKCWSWLVFHFLCVKKRKRKKEEMSVIRVTQVNFLLLCFGATVQPSSVIILLHNNSLKVMSWPELPIMHLPRFVCLLQHIRSGSILFVCSEWLKRRFLVDSLFNLCLRSFARLQDGDYRLEIKIPF